MKTYKVSLARSYLVTIEAENKEKACRFAEFFLGDCQDHSAFDDRQKNKFSITKVELAFNEAMEADELKE